MAFFGNRTNVRNVCSCVVLSPRLSFDYQRKIVGRRRKVNIAHTNRNRGGGGGGGGGAVVREATRDGWQRRSTNRSDEHGCGESEKDGEMLLTMSIENQRSFSNNY